MYKKNFFLSGIQKHLIRRTYTNNRTHHWKKERFFLKELILMSRARDFMPSKTLKHACIHALKVDHICS